MITKHASADRNRSKVSPQVDLWQALMGHQEKTNLVRRNGTDKISGQGVARRLALRAADSFWLERYYDFNVWNHQKFVETLRYIHRNPVERELVERPEDWAWSSFRHYLTGAPGTVEIESHWTVRKRERAGIF